MKISQMKEILSNYNSIVAFRKSVEEELESSEDQKESLKENLKGEGYPFYNHEMLRLKLQALDEEIKILSNKLNDLNKEIESLEQKEY